MERKGRWGRWTLIASGFLCLMTLAPAGAIGRSGEEDHRAPRRPPVAEPEEGPAPKGAPRPGELKAAGPVQQAAPVGGTWSAQGPGPTRNGQVENIQGGTNDPVVGAVHAIAAHPSNADILYVGGVNGGVWRTTNATAANPDWATMTDQSPSLSIAALEFDPTDVTNLTLVAGFGRFSNFGNRGGALAGLLRSTDGGNTWTQLGATDLAGRNVSSVAPRGSIILVAVNGGTSPGVYRSTDTGASFDLISGTNGLGTGAAFDLARDPGNSNRIYAGIGGFSGGIFRTDDAGASWTDVTDAAIDALVGGATDNLEIAVSAAAGNPVFAGIVNGSVLAGVFRSPDMGANWTAMDLPQTLDASTGIANASNTTPIVITTGGNHPFATGDRVRISGVLGNTNANGDFTVTVINNTSFSLNGSTGNAAYAGGGTAQAIQGIHHGGQGDNNFSIAADPSNGNLVYVGGDRQDFFPSSVGAGDFTARMFRGDASVAPGGPATIPSPQWTSLTHNGTASNSAPHADSRDMEFDANGNLLEGDDGGIYRRTSPANNAGDWFSVIGDLQVTEFHDIAYDSVSDILLGGAQDTGCPEQTGSGSTTWDSLTTADGGDVAADDYTVPLVGVRYWSNQFLGGFSRRACVAGNLCGGAVGIGLNTTMGIALMTGSTGNVQFVTPVQLNSQDGTRLIIGGLNDVYESMDRGDNLVQLTGPGANRNAMVYGHANNVDLIYVGSGSQVLVRTTAGGSLTATAGAYPGGSVTDIAVDPVDENIVYAIDTAQAFRTTDGGGSWNDITGNLDDDGNTNFRSIEYVPGAIHDKLVIGTQNGVFAAVEPHFSCWFELGEGLPNTPVWDLEFDAADGLLVAGTLGRGAWTLDGVADIEVPVLTVPGGVDFGDTCVGTTATETLNVCNTGMENLEIEEITTSDPQFEVIVPSSGFPVVISPDFCFPFQVTFTPTSAGLQSATLTIESNDPCASGSGVELTGNGTVPDVRVSGSTAFGDVCPGEQAEKVVNVCNVGGCNLNVISAEFVPPCPDFTLINNPFPAPVSPDFCAPLTIRFTPTSAGPKVCTLRITTDDPDTPVIDLIVTGNTPAAAIDVPPSMSFPPEVIQSVGACTTEQPFPISNTGTCPLVITDISLGGEDVGDYAMSGLPSFPIILEPGHIVGEGDFEVVFAPTVVDRDRLGNLTVTWISDPITGTPAQVTRDLCGEGVRTGARVLVTSNGVPLATVEQIHLQRLTANRNKNRLDSQDVAKNLALQTIDPDGGGICPQIQFHREYGGLSNPIQLAPGSYVVTVTGIVNGRRAKKTVGFDVQTCDFNQNINVDLP